MNVDQNLVDAAIKLLKSKFPIGSGGAAAMYTKSGKVLTSIGIEDSPNDSVNLCYETGCILEALKLGEEIVATVCVYRETTNSPILILTPCGICQERLRIWSGGIFAAVPQKGDSSKWESRTLDELEPYYWGNVLK
ncbi:MAG: cytidine deaminase [Candidatus Paceibacterota bacterium]